MARTMYSDGWSGLVAVKPVGMREGTGLVKCRVTATKHTIHKYGETIYTTPRNIVYKTRRTKYYQLIVSVPDSELFA